MGQLPPERITKSRPFLSTGVDYAGPCLLVAFRGRGNRTHKSYVCLFVCLATKVIHLEIAYDLTSAAFVAAFRRFVARRGHCSKLVSDNATNFRGADKELQAMFKAASNFYKDASQQLTNLGTDWKFIPPSAPHFGGIWEAGVKSVKYHLRRTIGDQHLSYEEMSILMCQIEVCLNSRPLCPISDNPFDNQPLTPAHLLIGEVLVNVPEKPYDGDEGHVLSR